MTFGLRGSSTTSVTPVFSLIVQNLRPGLAAVGGLVEPAIAARSPERPLGRDVHRVRSRGSMRILPMCSEFFSPTFFQVLPPSVRLVNAVAVADAPLAVVLAGADPDDVRILRVDHDAADRVRAFAVEDRRSRSCRRSSSSTRRPTQPRQNSASDSSDRPRIQRPGPRRLPDRSNAASTRPAGGTSPDARFFLRLVERWKAREAQERWKLYSQV